MEERIMKKAILLSIHPKWAAKIYSGGKKG